MLEPGERVVLRNTDDRMVWWRAGIVTLWLAAIVIPNLFPFGVAEAKFWWMVVVVPFMAAIFLLVAWASSIWLWAMTDRRILVREKPRDPVETMLVDEVDAAEIDGGMLRLTAGSKSLELPLSNQFCNAAMLRRILGNRLGNPGLPVAGSRDILSADETPRLRGLPEFTFVNITPFFMAGGALGIAALAFADLGHGIFRMTFLMFLLFSNILFPDLVAAWRRRGWWVAVTDRRLLLRRWHEPGRYDAISIADIDNADYDEKEKRFVLNCGDRKLFLTCGKSSARHILTALDRDPREALA